MGLSANTKLGPYVVLGPLDAGGMGEVYRAHDSQLDRTVALKILRTDLVGDANSIARFQREAKLASSLNHPHIISIYSTHESDGLLCIAMELVSGETLSTWLERHKPGLGRILEVFVQIADALAAAHAAEVVHRDIKPSNILVNAQGYAKILDFGLAKHVSLAAQDSSEATTLRDLTTGQNLLGTPAYMSPEQARGEPVDGRSDIFSVCVMLYEAVTGVRPFSGDSMVQLLNAVISTIPRPVRELNPTLPSELQTLLERGLAKDRSKRFQGMAELAAELRKLRSQVESGTFAPRPKARWTRIAIPATVTVVALLGSFAIYRSMSSRPASQHELRYERITDFSDSALAPTLSADGAMLAFISNGDFGTSAVLGAQLYLKKLPDGEAVALTSDAVPKHTPAFSPDGSRIVYTAIDKGFSWNSASVPVKGGDPSSFMTNASGVTWVNGGQLLYSEIEGAVGLHMGLMTSAPDRTGQRLVYMPQSLDGMAHRSALSPDRKWVLVVEMDGRGWLPCRVVPWDGSSPGRRVGPTEGQCTTVAWSPDGAWMYFSSDAGGAYHLWRQRFPDGKPEQLTFEPNEQEGTAIAPDGKSLITSVGTRQSTIWYHDERGERQITSQGQAMLPRLAPDGDTVYYLQQGGNARAYVSGELWKLSLRSGRHELVLPRFRMSHYDLSPDGKLLTFTGAEEGSAGIWVMETGHAGPPRRLTTGDEIRASFSADHDIFFLSEGRVRFLYRMHADGSDRRKVHDIRMLYMYSVSPDGRWAAVGLEQPGINGTRIALLPTRVGAEPFLICGNCITGFGPGRRQSPFVSWSNDGRGLFLSLQYFGRQSRNTVRLPFDSERPQPVRLASTDEEFAKLPGAQLIHQQMVFSSGSTTHYLYTQTRANANLYRVWLP